MEYHDRASGLPKSIRKVTAELAILEFTLKRLQDAFQDSSNDFGSIESFLPTLSQCSESIRDLNAMLQKIVPVDSDSRMLRVDKAFRSLLSDPRLVDTIKSIRKYVRTLTYASISLSSFKSMFASEWKR
jgi:hypothetical protein